MNIAEKIRNERKKAGLSQEALGEQLNVSRQAITKWENGSAMPETDKIILLSEFFRVSTDYLLKDCVECNERAALSSSPPKRKTSWRLKFGIPMFGVSAFVWLSTWYASLRYPVGFLNWDGTPIKGFWKYVKYYDYLFELLVIAFIVGLIGFVFILSDISMRTHFKNKLSIWLRKQSWMSQFLRTK